MLPQKEIKDACDKSLDELAKHVASGQPPETDADKYFEPLKIACLSKNPKMMEVSLDCIQKLIAYNYLRGEIKIENPNKDANESKEDNDVRSIQRTMMDDIIEVICSCNDSQDDNVQLQVTNYLILFTIIY